MLTAKRTSVGAVVSATYAAAPIAGCVLAMFTTALPAMSLPTPDPIRTYDVPEARSNPVLVPMALKSPTLNAMVMDVPSPETTDPPVSVCSLSSVVLAADAPCKTIPAFT
jgi:hypothetical protein